MYEIILRGLAIFVVLSAFGAAGCSREPPSGSAPAPNVAVNGDTKVQFDLKTLKECKQLADLPEGVQVLANNSFMQHRYDGTPTKFLVGGVGVSSAIVAYEDGGYVPSYYAQSYVLSSSRWVAETHWQLESEVTTLSALVSESTLKP
jgi:hypothetical protein